MRHYKAKAAEYILDFWNFYGTVSVFNTYIYIQFCHLSMESHPCAVTFSWWGIAYFNDPDSYAGWSLYSWSPCVLSPFRGGGIEYLNDPDSYAGWSFHTPVRATQVRQVEG